MLLQAGLIELKALALGVKRACLGQCRRLGFFVPHPNLVFYSLDEFAKECLVDKRQIREYS